MENFGQKPQECCKNQENSPAYKQEIQQCAARGAKSDVKPRLALTHRHIDKKQSGKCKKTNCCVAENRKEHTPETKPESFEKVITKPKGKPRTEGNQRAVKLNKNRLFHYLKRRDQRLPLTAVSS